MRMRRSSMETSEKHHTNHFRKWMSVRDYIKPGLKYGPSDWPRGFLGWNRACARESPGGHQMSKGIRRPLLTTVVSLLAATVACNQSSTAPHERFTLQGQVTG